MFFNYFYLKQPYNKSVYHWCHYLSKTNFTNKYTLISLCRYSVVSNTKLWQCLGHSGCFNRILRTPKINKIDNSVRSFSTSSRNFSNKDEDKKPDNDQLRSVLFNSAIIFFLLYYFAKRNEEYSKKLMVTWDDFKNEILAKGEVQKLIVLKKTENILIVLHPGAVIKNQTQSLPMLVMKFPETDKFEGRVREAERQLGIPPREGVPIEYNTEEKEISLITLTVFAAIFSLFAYHFTKNGGFSKLPLVSDLMNISKAKFTLVDPLAGQGKGVKFSDVAGLKEAKIEVMEFVDYLKRPEHYRNLGAKIPKGALLLGPPGCGKTLLAKAVATEANVPFLSMNGSEFVELLGGIGASRVRDLFKEAKKRIPCIIYIDEIDAIGKERTSGATVGHSEEEHTLNQLLVEMDGLVSNEGIVLLASTNRADLLDSALLRPGRFDRQILIGLPTFEERRQIFEQHLKSIHLENKPEYYSKRMAHLTPGFSGADIANVCNEAALHAAKFKKQVVQGSDLEYAVERVLGGVEKQSSSMRPEEKKMVAYYEAGRALVGWMSRYGYALLKITIVPRTDTPAGWTQFSQTDKFLYTKEELQGKMLMGLGGRVAVSLIFNKITTAGEKHLKQVTKLAYAQIKTYGMNENIGLLSFDPNDSKNYRVKPYSKQMNALFDEEARKLVASIYKETEKILLDNKDKLLLLAEELLKRETLNYNDVEKLIGPPPHGDKKVTDVLDFELSLKEAAGPDPEPKPKED